MRSDTVLKLLHPTITRFAELLAEFKRQPQIVQDAVRDSAEILITAGSTDDERMRAVNTILDALCVDESSDGW
jgi:hypothetical protein